MLRVWFMRVLGILGTSECLTHAEKEVLKYGLTGYPSRGTWRVLHTGTVPRRD